MRVEEKQRVDVRRRKSPAAGRDSITDVPSEAQRVYGSRCARKGVRQAMRARADESGPRLRTRELAPRPVPPADRRAPTEPPARRTARRRPGQRRRDRRRSEIKAFRRKTESNRFCNKDFPKRKMSARVQHATIPSLQGNEDGAGPTGAQPPAQAGTRRPFGEAKGRRRDWLWARLCARRPGGAECCTRKQDAITGRSMSGSWRAERSAASL